MLCVYMWEGMIQLKKLQYLSYEKHWNWENKVTMEQNNMFLNDGWKYWTAVVIEPPCSPLKEYFDNFGYVKLHEKIDTTLRSVK